MFMILNQIFIVVIYVMLNYLLKFIFKELKYIYTTLLYILFDSINENKKEPLIFEWAYFSGKPFEELNINKLIQILIKLVLMKREKLIIQLMKFLLQII